MAIITINSLALSVLVGTREEERSHPQEVTVNIEVSYDASRAVSKDDLDEALDYETLTQDILGAVQATSFYLLETLAQHIMNVVTGYPQVRKAKVRIEKPKAVSCAQSVAVELTFPS